jgi:hypothetical protein
MEINEILVCTLCDKSLLETGATTSIHSVIPSKRLENIARWDDDDDISHHPLLTGVTNLKQPTLLNRDNIMY